MVPPASGRFPNVVRDPGAGERLPLPTACDGGKQNQTAPGANVKAAIPSAGAALWSSIRGSASQVFTDCVVFFKLPFFAKYFPCH